MFLYWIKDTGLANRARHTWLLRMLPGVRFGGRPKTPGPSKTIAPGACPCLGASSRPPGRTMVYGMPERCSASSPRFFQNRTCTKVETTCHVLADRLPAQHQPCKQGYHAGPSLTAQGLYYEDLAIISDSQQSPIHQVSAPYLQHSHPT